MNEEASLAASGQATRPEYVRVLQAEKRHFDNPFFTNGHVGAVIACGTGGSARTWSRADLGQNTYADKNFMVQRKSANRF